MIAVRLMAGLGNQMFQYATGLALAHKYNTKLMLDISSYKNMSKEDTPREYGLNIYPLRAGLASKKTMGQIVNAKENLSRLDSLKRLIGLYDSLVIMREKHPGFNEEIFNAGNNTYLIGWWQNEGYFSHIRDEILKSFTPKIEPNAKNLRYIKSIQSSNSIGIHVRRGDYVQNKHANKYHGLTGIEYYKKAISKMSNIVDSPTFVVFSDDIDWCKRELPVGKNSIFVKGNDRQPHEDIRLMSLCEHNIIANSSFSWWGAWLNNNTSKTVIAPKMWVSDQRQNAKIDIIPKNWIRL